MSAKLDIDDLVSGTPEAQAELDRLRKADISNGIDVDVIVRGLAKGCKDNMRLALLTHREFFWLAVDNGLDAPAANAAAMAAMQNIFGVNCRIYSEA